MWPNFKNNAGTIVAIGAHYDDIELGCGGTLAAAAQAGWNITLLITTDSKYTSINNTKRSKKLAHKEGLAAAKILGANVINLGFKCSMMTWNYDAINAIEKVLDDKCPDIIFTHYVFDTHQDHYYTTLSSLSAARFKPTIMMYEPLYPSGRSYQPFNPQVYVDISSTINIKKQLISCHASQVHRYGPNWIKAIESRAHFRGYETGVEFAEAFCLLRMLCK